MKSQTGRYNEGRRGGSDYRWRVRRGKAYEMERGNWAAILTRSCDEVFIGMNKGATSKVSQRGRGENGETRNMRSRGDENGVRS